MNPLDKRATYEYDIMPEMFEVINEIDDIGKMSILKFFPHAYSYINNPSKKLRIYHKLLTAV